MSYSKTNTHATQTIKLTLQYEIQIGAKALSELKPISRGAWAVKMNAVSIPRVERLQLTVKPQLFLHITYGYIIKHYALLPGTKKKPELRAQLGVSVCTAACRSFPLEHAYTHDVTHTRYESKEPALYVII